jgi:hypothetical protein
MALRFELKPGFIAHILGEPESGQQNGVKRAGKHQAWHPQVNVIQAA